MNDMKRVSAKRNGCTHIEGEGFIVNIYTDLANWEGTRIVAIEVIADDCIGEEWHIALGDERRQTVGLRVIEGKKPE